jgi:energy-converting hydrogenase Eha subunit C
LHQPVLQTLVSAVISIVTTGFIGVLLAVYYFDVRIRREGLDMQSAIDRLQAQT